jgi:hypothetical protein
MAARERFAAMRSAINCNRADIAAAEPMLIGLWWSAIYVGHPLAPMF